MSEVWVAALIGGGAAVVGSAISADSTRSASNTANDANAANIAATNSQNWNQYLLSRGTSTGALAGVPAGNVNTVLPLGFTLNGQPAETELLNRIFGASGGGGRFSSPGYITSPENIASFFAANPQAEQDLAAMLTENGDTRSVAQWVADDAAAGGTAFTAQLTNHANTQQQAYAQTLQLSPQYQQLLTYGPKTLDQLYGGDFLNQQLGVQSGVDTARLNLAGTVQQGIDEQRTKFGDLNTGQLADLDRILNTNKAGSQGIYDASLLSADTYANAVKQSTADELQRQRAARTLQGFVGEGSGDSLLRARTLASGYQAAGGARAQAGVDQANRLYGINNADATGRFGVNSDYLKALSQLLNANGAAASGQAVLQNATDRAAITSNDIATRLATMNQPGALVTQGLGIQQQQANAPYNDINALLSALGFFRQNQPATPNTLTQQVQPGIGGGQILGAGLTAAGTGLSQYYQNQQLINSLKGMGGSGSGGSVYAGGGGATDI